jgi:hypothetical protein
MKIKSSPTLSPLLDTNPTIPDTIGGTLLTAAPPAFWRMIKIGKTAGLVTPAQQDAIVEAFDNAARARESIDAALNSSQRSVTEFYILVTLFSAEPRLVSEQTLSRETFANSGSLRFALERLVALAAIAREVDAVGEPHMKLTSSGRALSARLTYSALNAVVSRTSTISAASCASGRGTRKG